MGAAALGLGGLAIAPADAVTFPAINFPPHLGPVRPALMARAIAAFQRHGDALPNRDTIGIVDMGLPSAQPRFHLIDMASGRTTSLLVAHGKGSDPAHTGLLQRFSNVDGSEASSSGAYVTRDIYIGKHGRSRRLAGLDASNCNAESRAIVLHGAWYVSPDLVRQHGKIGRSQGCPAVSEKDLEQVLARLGPGRMIYTDKV
jgi:hypothetical protein